MAFEILSRGRIGHNRLSQIDVETTWEAVTAVKRKIAHRYRTRVQSSDRALTTERVRVAEVLCGPGKVPVQLKVNGKYYSLQIEPRRTLLDALRQDLHLTGPGGERISPIENFFQHPDASNRRLNTLGPAEVITEINLPLPEKGSRGIYLKAMNRRVWTFALASVAVQLVMNAGTVRDIRLVLGGVANVPWRLYEAENTLRDRRLDAENIDRAADIAVTGAHPLRENGYKISLVKGMMKEALTALQ